MTRLVQWCLGGLFLGLIMHFAMIFTIPQVASKGLWPRITALGPAQTILPFKAVTSGDANPLLLDPSMVHAACYLSLAETPGSLTGELPSSFWSVAVLDSTGSVIFSTTNRSGKGRQINIGVFNKGQVADLSRQEYEIDEDILIIEATSDEVFFIIRIWPPSPAMRPRFEQAIQQLTCGELL